MSTLNECGILHNTKFNGLEASTGCDITQCPRHLTKHLLGEMLLVKGFRQNLAREQRAVEDLRVQVAKQGIVLDRPSLPSSSVIFQPLLTLPPSRPQGRGLHQLQYCLDWENLPQTSPSNQQVDCPGHGNCFHLTSSFQKEKMI